MTIPVSRETLWMMGAVGALLVVSSAAGFVLKRCVTSEAARAAVANLNARTRAWWAMVAVFVIALMTRGIGTIVLFALTSFLALREYITIAPTNRRDHRALFWSFFVVLPLQYWFLYTRWYGMASIFIPVYAFLFVAARNAVAGECERYLERTAVIQWGLMVCVYFLSYVPMLLTLDIPGYEGKSANLLFFLVLVVEASDVFQYAWGKLLGRRRIAPAVSPNKTVEGFAGGILSASLLGMAMWWATPFSPWQALALSGAATVTGFFGGLTMSAVKRDRGVKDYGQMIAGHGGVMDRVDSLCFAAPVFFHLVRYYFT
jgi:phosphatidate cytidylyltransferase